MDDHPRVLEETADALERESDHISTITAPSVTAALDVLEDVPLDCIVSDYRMPGRNGLEFLDRVRADYGAMPFVLFTGRGSEEVASEAISRGVTDYVTKGPRSDLYARLANCVENAVDAYRTELRLAGFLEASPDCLAVVDDDGVIRQTNALLDSLFGYERGELVGEPIRRLFPAEYHEEVASVHDANGDCVGSRPVPDDLDLHGQRQEGTEFPVDLSRSPRGIAGTDEVVVSIRDATQRRRRERQIVDLDRLNQTLRETTQAIATAATTADLELADALFENTQDALFVIEVDEAGDAYRVERVNPVYERVTGFSNEDLRGRTLRDAFGTEDGDTILRKYRRCVSRREPMVYEERLSIPTTGTYWETRIAPVIVDGRVVRLVGATRDVTEDKEREHQYDAIFNQTYQFTGLLDPDGRILRANETALEFGGLDRSDVVGDLLWKTEWFSDDDGTADRVRELVRRAGEGEFVRTHIDVCGPENVARTDFSIKPVSDETDAVVFLVTEARDVTELTKRERELERQNERLDEFASVVSHDLRNPLTVAFGSLDLARTTGDRADFDRVRAALDRMQVLIEDLLTLAREGQRVEQSRVVALDEQVRAAWETVPSDDATLEVVLDEYCVTADVGRLQQLLENLLSNAVRHGGADVMVRVGPLADERGFFVADDGPGIPKKKRDAVFDHGFSTCAEGTGLGLAIVRGIVEAHGWTIDVCESDLGGARFEITLDPPVPVCGPLDGR
ncbi:PAS domain S-box protein [Haloarculaceae archaeon H-GB1-1]|nr:PAS domain S-box protein [Haloarculaceae archaeon H-GB1-1]